MTYCKLTLHLVLYRQSQGKIKKQEEQKMKLLQTEWAFIIDRLEEVAKNENTVAMDRLQAIEILKKLKETPVG